MADALAQPRHNLQHAHGQTLQQLKKPTGKSKGLLQNAGVRPLAGVRLNSIPGLKFCTGFCTQVDLNSRKSSTPGGTRTPNPWFRRPMLYPIELRTHALEHSSIRVRGPSDKRRQRKA